MELKVKEMEEIKMAYPRLEKREQWQKLSCGFGKAGRKENIWSFM